jgi:hypothetical protein
MKKVNLADFLMVSLRKIGGEIPEELSKVRELGIEIEFEKEPSDIYQDLMTIDEAVANKSVKDRVTANVKGGIEASILTPALEGLSEEAKATINKAPKLEGKLTALLSELNKKGTSQVDTTEQVTLLQKQVSDLEKEKEGMISKTDFEGVAAELSKIQHEAFTSKVIGKVKGNPALISHLKDGDDLDFLAIAKVSKILEEKGLKYNNKTGDFEKAETGVNYQNKDGKPYSFDDLSSELFERNPTWIAKSPEPAKTTEYNTEVTKAKDGEMAFNLKDTDALLA